MTRFSVELIIGLVFSLLLFLIAIAGKSGPVLNLGLLLISLVLLVDAVRSISWVKAATDAKVRNRRRAALVTAVVLLLALFGYWTWPSRVQVKFRAFIPHSEVPYPPGTIIGNLKWSTGWTDLRVDVENGRIPIQNLDLSLETNELIAGVAQVSKFPNFTADPVAQILDEQGNGIKFGQGAMIIGKDDKGNPVNEPLEFGGPGSICQTYRIHCANLFSEATLQLVVATTHFNPPGPHGEPPQTLVGPRTPPKFIKLKGTYETAGPEGAHRYAVDETISLRH